MNALHKKTNKFILDKPVVEVYNNNSQWGRFSGTLLLRQESAEKRCAQMHARYVTQGALLFCKRWEHTVRVSAA